MHFIDDVDHFVSVKLDWESLGRTMTHEKSLDDAKDKWKEKEGETLSIQRVHRSELYWKWYD